MKAIKGKPFFRGVKLAGHKAPTENLPVERAEPRGDVAIPLRQHAGAPAEAIVAAGQHVMRGELIARAAGAVSANVHASVSGEGELVPVWRIATDTGEFYINAVTGLEETLAG